MYAARGEGWWLDVGYKRKELYIGLTGLDKVNQEGHADFRIIEGI